MRYRLFSQGIVLLFLVCYTTGCCGLACTLSPVDFNKASEATKDWLEACLDSDPRTAGRYWSPAFLEAGAAECRSVLLLRRSLVESSAIPGIDYYVYHPSSTVSVASVQQDISAKCATVLRAFVKRGDKAQAGALGFFVANGSSGPDRVVLDAALNQCTWPDPSDAAGWRTFENCFWKTAGVPGAVQSVEEDAVHVFRIDVRSPNLSFEMVMAKDSTNVNEGKANKTSPREMVKTMVARRPYSDTNPVLAFNADYFAPDNDHGPEGLTIKNGTRFDGKYAVPPAYDAPSLAPDGNTNETNRSSLSISKTNKVRIGIQEECKTNCFYFPFDGDAYYNTVGGGPLFIEDQKRVGGFGSTLPCQNEGFATGSGGYCGNSSKAWTAVGVSQDGRYLIVVVGNDQTMDSIASILLAEGAARAMKLDGGSSTQLWYKQRGVILGGGKSVANAIVIFSRP